MPRRAELLRASLPLLLPLALAGCFERTRATVENRPIPVMAVRVSLAPADEPLAFAGVIRPRREADIAFRAGGRIVSREVDVGDVVHAGDVLARLDPSDLALSVRSAEADLASAEAEERQASADARRSRVLAAKGWTSVAADEEKQATARAAIARVASARAALALARNKQGYAVLVAPAAGVVTATMADPGAVVSEGEAVMRLAQRGTLEAEVGLPETAIEAARRASVTIDVWSHPEGTLRGTLRELSPTADARLRTYTARFTIPDAPDWLAQGMSVTVHLSQTGNEPVARLPLAAVTDRGAGPMVWLVGADGGDISARPVRVVALRADQALVSGLADGDLVVSLGVHRLDPHARVRVADMQPVAP
jgi:RND family efflux transporter MFP subunit